MRKSNWKTKVLFFIACIIGIIAGIAVAIVLPETLSVYKGLITLLTILFVAMLVILVGIKVFRIGSDR